MSGTTRAPLACREMVHMRWDETPVSAVFSGAVENFQSLVLWSILLTHVDIIKRWKKASM